MENDKVSITEKGWK